ncbi:hypothetical protein [Tamlana flava]|uniref:hypothetical protein n=1 Tax=Tamlana flava TaxID=3158572 RepID=UPI00351B3096
MIKFFRKIRQNLVSEGKTIKYLKYAIGEIILVVVGILIAIQLNTWKENKKLNEIRHQYYVQLLDELNDNKNYINEIIEKYSQNISMYDSLIQSQNSPNLTTEQILKTYYLVNYRYYNILFQTGTIESLQNTGEIKLIPLSIRYKLLNLKRTMDRRVVVNQELNQEFKDRSRAANLMGASGLSQLNDNKIYSNKTISEYMKESEVEMILSLNTALLIKRENEEITVVACNDLLKEIGNIENLIHSELNK